MANPCTAHHWSFLSNQWPKKEHQENYSDGSCQCIQNGPIISKEKPNEEDTFIHPEDEWFLRIVETFQMPHPIPTEQNSALECGSPVMHNLLEAKKQIWLEDAKDKWILKLPKDAILFPFVNTTLKSSSYHLEIYFQVIKSSLSFLRLC